MIVDIKKIIDFKEINPFITKLYQIVSNLNYYDIISWNQNGDAIEIKNEYRLK